MSRCTQCLATTRAEAEKLCESRTAPCPADYLRFPDDEPEPPGPITARDLFAAAALASGRIDFEYAEDAPRIAFQIADAMMEARMKK